MKKKAETSPLKELNACMISMNDIVTRIRWYEDMRYRLATGEADREIQTLTSAKAQLEKQGAALLAAFVDAGITDPRLQEMYTRSDTKALEKIERWVQCTLRPTGDNAVSDVKYAYHANPLAYTLAYQPISAKQYWQAYFAKHGKQPSKIVWYKTNQDPTEALNDFKHQNGLSPWQHKDVNLTEMFQENIIGQDEMYDLLGRERELIWQYAQEIIAERYPRTETTDEK